MFEINRTALRGEADFSSEVIVRSYNMARYGGPGRAKVILFTRPSMLVGPQLGPSVTRGGLVEPPGIAPGSGPLITGTFIAIVRPRPDTVDIGLLTPKSKVCVGKIVMGSAFPSQASGCGTRSAGALHSSAWPVSGLSGPDHGSWCRQSAVQAL